ncbi:MAG: hypothetical protein LBP53_05775 [Candidatus Peribacteria bacterium]|jgi:hypothetical protein|nr:hypothetical protein [Candidatus Peribacteria bacterium]
MLVKIRHQPLSFGMQELLWIAGLLLLTSFIITLEIQQRRLKTSLPELPTHQTSHTKQRISALVVFIVISVLTVVYFIIGKHAQTVPEVPDSYFDKTREHPNLLDEENGYEQLRKLIGDVDTPLEEQKVIMEKYPFKYQIDQQESRELRPQVHYGNKLSVTDPAYFTTPKYRIPGNNEQYTTLMEYLATRPDEMNTEKLETLMHSDFFPRLSEIVEMERKNTDITIPKIQNIQSLERVLQRLVAYYADTGNLETAVKLNIIALKLGDNYLSTYGSLTHGLIGIVNFNLAVNATEYLLSRYELSEDQRLALLETYQNILTTDKEEALRNIFRGEYHAMRAMTNGFNFIDPNEIANVGGKTENLSALGALLLRKPFYDREATIAQYQYALQKGSELVLQGVSNDEMLTQIGVNPQGDFFQRPQARNRYNIVGNITISTLFPRLIGSYAMLEALYHQKELMLQQLQSPSSVISDNTILDDTNNAIPDNPL